ncbi:MAG TPA: maleylpyruvate isomerase family mycothiol-dependent enzyme [Acidimicrobiales bacterium]|nr:maleylpyruvate isomerase family mycothiol-dependent enzyme [Acidimicrobiales bacterium]
MAGSDDPLMVMVADSYSSLADLLGDLGPEAWEAASLCEGWRVREVVAHLTMPVRYDEEAFTAELRECQFDFTRLSNRVAARDAELPVTELVANLRDPVMRTWTPPGGGSAGALSHVVIHGLDITAALGERRRASDEAVVAVLDGLAAGGGHAHFGADIEGLRLEATDLDWSYGSGGRTLRGSADDLVLHLCGRTVPAGRLGDA